MLFMATIKETCEQLRHDSLHDLIKATWSVLKDYARDMQELHIEYAVWNESRHKWQYIGIGTSDCGVAVICGQFTRSLDNYLNRDAVLYHAAPGLKW